MNQPTDPKNALPVPPLFSAVDSARFGVRIGRVNLAEANAWPAALEASRQEKLRLMFIRCPTDQLTLVHALEDAGARLMDTLLYYRRKLSSAELPAELKPNRIRTFRTTDQAAIEDIARQSFAGYQGHYHADPALERARADEGYVEWALHCCRSRSADSEVLVAEDDKGQACGFLAVQLNSTVEGECRLTAVAPTAKGSGRHWSLLVHALHWCRGRGAACMIISTQVTNTAAQRTYGGLGFDLYASYYTFHLWQPNPRA